MGSRDYQHPLAYSYDDVSFAAFENDTGLNLKIPADSEKRFGLRAAWVNSSATTAKVFTTWRAHRLTRFLGDILRRVQIQRADLQMTNMVVTETPAMFEQMAARNQSLANALKEFAIDLPALAQVEGMTEARWTISWREDKWWSSQDPWLWQIKEDADMVSAFAGQTQRVVLCRTSWDENLIRSPGKCDIAQSWGSNGADRRDTQKSCRCITNGSDWRIGWQRTRALPQPGGRNAREALAQALITADATNLVAGFADLNTVSNYPCLLFVPTLTRWPCAA